MSHTAILILRNWFILFFESLYSVLRILLLSSASVKSFKNLQPRLNKNCAILGNGPSLSSDLTRMSIKFLAPDSIITVNYFPTTQYYMSLKPSNLVLSAPEFWLENIDESYFPKRDHLFKCLKDNTSWPLILFIPIEAKGYHKWKNQIDNNNIQIKYYNNTPVTGFSWFENMAYKLNLGMPRPHNVLIPALMIAINQQSSVINILGADHSWLEEISVDRDNNVLLNQKHFYDVDTSKPYIMLERGKGQRKLHEILKKFVFTFEAYFKLNRYAISRNCTIYNCTINSYIDAFERRH